MVSLIIRYSSVVFLILKDVFKNKIVQAKNWLGIPQVMDILRLDICPMLAILISYNNVHTKFLLVFTLAQIGKLIGEPFLTQQYPSLYAGTKLELRAQ